MPTIRKRGKRWQAQVRIKQDGAIVYSESASFDTKAAAQHWAVTLEASVKRDGPENRKAAQVTVADLVSTWLAAKERSSSVSRGLQHSASALMKSPFGPMPVNKLKPADVVAWGQAVAETLAPATVMHHLMVLRSAFTSAETLAGVTVDVTVVAKATDQLRRLRLAAASQRRERRISDDELRQILQHLRGKDLRVRTDSYVELAVALPRRREELLTARWEDYDSKAGTLLLRDTKHPTKIRSELIPVPPDAQRILSTLPRIDERILPYKPESVSAAFQRAVAEIGLSDIRLHDLRHEGISRLFERGLEIQEVSMISGHTSWVTLRRYTHLKPSDVLEKLNARVKKASQAGA